MSVTYTCPECGTALRPAKPVPMGKKIKCPKCATVFAPTVKATAAKGAKPAAKPAKKPDEEWGDTNPYTVKEAEIGPKEGVDFINIRDRFAKSARGPAQKAVVRPANAMLALSILQCLLCIGGFLYGLWPFIFITDIGDSKNPKSISSYASAGLGEKQKGEMTTAEKQLQIAIMGASVFAFLWNATCCVAAFKMHTLESIAWAWVGAVMTLLGVGIIGLGLLVGIWSMMVLNRDEVKEGFAEQNPYK